MSEPYLLLTQNSAEDAKRWCESEYYALAIAKGTPIVIFNRISALAETSLHVPIIVLNMARFPEPHPENEVIRGQLLSGLRKLCGDRPRIWAHFGGINSPEATATTIASAMNQECYKALAAAFGGYENAPIMPYSQSSEASWDKKLKELTKQVHAAVTANSALENIEACIRDLDKEWEKVKQHIDPQSVVNIFNALPKLEAMKILLAVAIYCDGLLYAHEHAQDKVETMRNLLTENVASEMRKIRNNYPTALEQLGATSYCENLENALSAIGSNSGSQCYTEGIDEEARKFLSWYRDAVKALYG